MTEGYLTELSRSKRVASVERSWTTSGTDITRIKPWYQPGSDDVIHRILPTVGGSQTRRGGTISWPARWMWTMKVTYQLQHQHAKRFRELYGPDVVIDEFYTDSKFDQPMIDMARHAFMVKGNTITQVSGNNRKQQRNQ